MRILINALTLENATLLPLLMKIKIWQKYQPEIWFLGNSDFEKRIKSLRIIGKNFNLIKISHTRKIKTRLELITEGLSRNLKACLLIKNFQKLNQFDLVYSVSSVLDLILFPFFLKIKQRKIKWATVFDNTVPLIIKGNLLIRFLAWLFFQISLLLLKKADYIFVISSELKNYLLKRGFSSKKIIITGNAIESDFLKKAQPQKDFQSDALYLGRINELKGIYDLLSVLLIVKKEYPHFKLTIMGKGDIQEVKKYKNYISQKGLAKNIKFLGFKSGLTKFSFIKSSKIFLFLSHSESFGVALLEAVAAGLPAFAYNLPCYQQIYKNNEVFFFEKNDYQGIAHKIIEIFKRKAFINKRGKKLLNKYSWRKIADKEFKTFLRN